MAKEDGGGAFPRNVEGNYFMGMTLRDYFAAKAMQAYVQQKEIMIALADESATIKKICTASYDWADAMLKARD